ncbi:MAG: hypothetical protein ACRDIV_12315 [Ktedonobacteraceae bacterium]
MNSILSLALILMGSSCLYLLAIASSFRLSGKRRFSPPWLLLPLSGAAIIGITLVFSVPALPASTVPTRLLALLAHLFNILLIWAITSKIAPERRLPATLLYAWNPLILIELAVYGNTSAEVICLILLAIATPLVSILSSPLQTIVTLVLIGLAVRINFMALLIAPLWLWFMVRHTCGVARALMGFAWHALIVLAVFVVAYIPAWQGSATFLAITNALNLFNFANSPLSLVVMLARPLFKFVAQNGHFPPSLMQPGTAADMTVLATSLFLFALLYLREMGRVRARRVGLITHEPSRESRCIEGKGTRAAQAPPPILPTSPAPTEAFPTRPGRGGGGWEGWWGRLRRPHLHSTDNPVQGNEVASDLLYSYHTLFTGWLVVFLGYIVLAVTVFGPGYIVWGVWIVALRRFDALSVCALLLSCSTLLYYPLQQLAPHSTAILLPVCIFSIPLVYLIVQRYIPAGKIARKNVLT